MAATPSMSLCSLVKGDLLKFKRCIRMGIEVTLESVEDGCWCHLLLVKTTRTDMTKRHICGSHTLFRQTVAAVSVLALLGNRQRAEPELLVNKTAVGETEAELATHHHRQKVRKKKKQQPNIKFEEPINIFPLMQRLHSSSWRTGFSTSCYC